MPCLTSLIRLTKLKIYLFVGSLPNAATQRRKSEVREKLCKVLWKAENQQVRLLSFLLTPLPTKVFCGVLQSTPFIWPPSQSAREMDMNSLFLELFQDQTIDLYLLSCIKKIASTLTLLWQGSKMLVTNSSPSNSWMGTAFSVLDLLCRSNSPPGTTTEMKEKMSSTYLAFAQVHPQGCRSEKMKLPTWHGSSHNEICFSRH